MWQTSAHVQRRRCDNRTTMNKQQPAALGAPERDGGRRLTVGVLAGWPVYDAEALNPFLGAVLKGFRTAAAEHDCNLLIAAGSEHLLGDAVCQAAWPFAGASSEVAPVGHFNTDALMVVPPVRTAAARRYLNDLAAARFPVTFLGAESGAAYVAIDNRAGITAAFEHLVAHGHECVAFVAGDPSDRGDTRSRLHAFRAAATEAGLEVDDRLIAYGSHTRHGGRAATERILGSGVAFTALMASNDQSAIGAMDVFGREQLRVPHDVAVVGFDDQPSAAAHVPSLTSVAYPLKAAAHALLELTLRRIRAPQQEHERIIVEPRLVTRLSCGCVPGSGYAGASGRSERRHGSRSIDRIVRAVLQHLRAEGSARWHGAEPEDVCRGTVAAFLRVLAAEGDHASFIATLAPILHYVERVDADANACQAIVTELRREMITRLADDTVVRRERAEDLLHGARLAFSEAAHRRDRRHRVEADYRSNAVGRVTAHLLAATTEEQIRAVLREHLGDVGIREAALLTMSEHANVAAERPIGLDAIADAARRGFPGFSEGLQRRDERFHLALVPITFDGEQVGCALFDAARMGPLGTIARQIGAGLDNARLHAEVLRLSLTDPLTGLRNRAYLELALEDEFERSARYGRPLSVLILDIDHFKDYNDTFGHAAGDVALLAVAKAARSVARDADVLARYGGEEFVMVMAETDDIGGHGLAERIRHAVRDLQTVRQKLTVSIGVASLSPSDPVDQSAHALLERADRALYRAKRTGRDRVCLAPGVDARQSPDDGESRATHRTAGDRERDGEGDGPTR